MKADSELAAELAEARRRLAALEAAEAERQRAADVQAALHRIAELAGAAQDMQEFYRAVHGVVGELMNANNFYIALYDDERQLINWPYWADEVDKDFPDANEWVEFGDHQARGATGYLLRTGEPQLLSYERQKELIERGDVELIGVLTEESSWLGVPLKAEGRTVGVLVVQSYTKDVQYTEQDKDLLAFVGQHVGAALSRARAIEETRQRNAELALINSVQEALAGELELQAIYDIVGDKIRDVFDAQVVDISVYDEKSDLLHVPYSIERGVRFVEEPRERGGFRKHVMETRETLLINEHLAEAAERYGSTVISGEMPKSVLFVPLITGGKVTGVISLQNIDREHAFSVSDQQLLETLARSLSVALENARLVHETRQRNAELALINSVQEALAGELELQAIYDVVGDKIQEIFDAQVVDIAVLDEASGLVHFPYTIERGVRLPHEPIELIGFRRHVIEGRASIMINEDTAGEAERYGNPVLFGEMPKSVLFVPLIAGGKATGVISLQNLDREHAFADSDQQLLETLARSLSVALENARLVHETRQRNAELALINSVQESLAGELEMQAIYDAVGDKIQEIFDAQVVDIAIFDFDAGLTRYAYTVERGVRLPDETLPIKKSPTTRELFKTKAPVLINDVPAWERERGESAPVRGGEPALSVLVVPLISGEEFRGRISLQNLDRTNVFTESDVRLLTTLAGSLSVALENARLVHETRQRNAELALINSVQEALAGELEMQAIYDVVGDKIQEIFDAQVVDIGIFDFAAGLTHHRYVIERGVRLSDVVGHIGSLNTQLLETKAPILINDIPAWEIERGEELPVPAGEPALAMLIAPLFSGEEVYGRISLQNLDRTNVFKQSDARLLTTLAGSLSVALENARLVHETRQRNAELALINSVQAAIAGELDPQAIYDLVGDKLQEVFDAQVVSISVYDEATGQLSFPYVIERGERLDEKPIALIGFRRHVIETREPLMLEESTPEVAERYGNPYVLSGEPVKSALFVPMVVGGRATGVISLQNVDRTHAFTDADERLLSTLAGSLSVALDNARLVHETRQRNAELALINSVQEALAGELEMQAIYDVVGDKIREVFDAQIVDIAVYDASSSLVHFPYSIVGRERSSYDPMPLTSLGVMRRVIETREPWLINEDARGALERYGLPVVMEPVPRSTLCVPLVAGGKATGLISLQNRDREHAFTDADQRLLTTLAASLSSALENARLVHETRQRNAELALINSVQDSLAGELDPQAIYDLVGEKLREVFDAQVVDIAVHDEDAELLRFVYQIERGVHYPNATLPVIGFRKHVMETREPLAIPENIDEALVKYGNPETVVGEPSHGSAIFQPLVIGGRATGAISIQNLDREHAFSESDQRLLATIAGSLGVALENAQLIDETRQRVSELGTVNSVGQALATQLELAALIDLVGERVRETFAADIAYVALHDEDAGQIDFVYYYEAGERGSQPPLRYGEGLTSQILETREPLLLIREEQYEGLASVGTPSKSYVGVPIMAGDKAIGVLSVQSTTESGRFAEPDVRLLATIASNVGVAIQNARLFAEIERQREHFESLVEISPVAVVVMDADEHVTGWNPAAAELFGHTSEEAVGRPVDELVFSEDTRDQGREVTHEALTQGEAHRITRRWRKDGSAVDVELMLVPLLVDEARVGFLGIYHDITELQRAREEAEAATQAKSAFLATMSHEIRTPMNAVIGMTGLLLGTELTAEQREFAEVVRSSGDALLHVIDDILDYSKIEAGKLELEREPLDLRECVEGALDIVAPRASQKEIELGCLIDDEVPAGITGDAARLRQVLLNLLSNAVKFTEQGEVVVLVGAELVRAGCHRLRIAVRDTGIGIPQDRMDRLFDSFSQIDTSTTRRYGGTGLGLAISKRLVELMDGTMWVESEEGKGSTFHIDLTAAEAEVPARITPGGGLPELAGKRILVVDDNATNREIVIRHARAWGMEPVAVERPIDALALIEAGEPFDVAVLDMLMPEMDGLALAREIRQRRDENELPLLLVTSLGRLPRAQSASDFSAQLAKPIKASQLFNALVGVLAKRVEEPQAAAATVDGDEPAASPLRILLAEDNAVNQKVALALLGQLGYRADVAWNGLEALAALERHPYDVVLMDVQMPELDGLDATRQICARWSPEARPRIIAMTANALLEDREECFAAGMDDYVAKPIRPEELAQALTRAKPLGATSDGGSDVGLSLDSGALDNLRELGGDDFLTEVIDTFLADAPALLATLRRSLEEQDAGELRRAAHTLKSNGATLGAGDFAELCRTVEQRAKDGQLTGASELVDRIEQEYVPLREALAKLRSKAPA
jgi:PAS domain S-box-containing protein